jgi:hypothetical protein
MVGRSIQTRYHAVRKHDTAERTTPTGQTRQHHDRREGRATACGRRGGCAGGAHHEHTGHAIVGCTGHAGQHAPRPAVRGRRNTTRDESPRVPSHGRPRPAGPTDQDDRGRAQRAIPTRSRHSVHHGPRRDDPSDGPRPRARAAHQAGARDRDGTVQPEHDRAGDSRGQRRRRDARSDRLGHQLLQEAVDGVPRPASVRAWRDQPR